MSSINLSEKTGGFVRIVPMETNPNHKDKYGKKTTVKRQWQSDKKGRFFFNNLSTTQLKVILSKSKVKMENLLLEDEGHLIVYRYKCRPLIELNLQNGQFYSFKSEIEEYGKEAVQQQAHIVLEILKQNGFSAAVHGKEIYPTSVRQLLGQLKTYKQDS